MTDRSTTDPRRSPRWAAAGIAVVALVGLTLVVLGLHHGSGPPQAALDTPVASASPTASPSSSPPSGPPSSPPSGSATTKAPPQKDFGPVLERSRPLSLDIPSIGVHAPKLVDLGKNADGSLEVPKDFGTPGWYTLGQSPGQFGPAVIAGHVDSKKGPAVFYRLGALRPGAKVTVKLASGTSAVFVVDRVARYPKDRFPTAEVYGNTTDRAELRLITCGGDFDHETGHYVDNTVAFAHLV